MFAGRNYLREFYIKKQEILKNKFPENVEIHKKRKQVPIKPVFLSPPKRNPFRGLVNAVQVPMAVHFFRQH